jgi:hypothetical protein
MKKDRYSPNKEFGFCSNLEKRRKNMTQEILENGLLVTEKLAASISIDDTSILMQSLEKEFTLLDLVRHTFCATTIPAWAAFAWGKAIVEFKSEQERQLKFYETLINAYVIHWSSIFIVVRTSNSDLKGLFGNANVEGFPSAWKLLLHYWNETSSEGFSGVHATVQPSMLKETAWNLADLTLGFSNLHKGVFDNLSARVVQSKFFNS